MKELRAGTRRTELRPKPWKSAVYWLVLCASLLLSYITQDHLFRDDTTYGGLDPPTSVIIRKKN